MNIQRESVGQTRKSSIIVYSRDAKGLTPEAVAILGGLTPIETVRAYGNLPDLIEQLAVPQRDTVILILFIENTEELSRFQLIQPLISLFRTIVILPDNQAETISAGHNLFPRYLTVNDHGLDDVRAVVDRMINT